MQKLKGPVLLAILDGFGLAPKDERNAIYKAKATNIFGFWDNYPHLKLRASAEAVGLPKGQMGNSEVGHLTMGAGRTIYTGLSLINKAIADGSFTKNKTLLTAISHVKAKKSTLHLMGLLSPGGVHSHEKHFYELLKMAQEAGLESNQIVVHCFTDGRDVDPHSAVESVSKLQDKLSRFGGKIGIVAGRYYGMDRDRRWQRTQKVVDLLEGRASEPTFSDPLDYLKKQYEAGITDEFIVPARSTEKSISIKNGDAVVGVNFRPDRMRQITHCLIPSGLYDYEPTNGRPDIYFCAMSKYEGIKCPTAFAPFNVKNTLGDLIAKWGYKQLRLAETEKYAHVTFFFDGGREIDHQGGRKILIPSNKEVATYDLYPQMSAYQITEQLLQHASEYDFIILNFANADMVGHSGNFPAVVKAVKVVDECFGKILEEFKKINGTIFLTADHGNADEMITADGRISTKHSTNLVPFVINDKTVSFRKNYIGKMADVAPTILEYCGLEIPDEMDGTVLLEK